MIQTYPNYSDKEILAEVERARSVVSQIARAPRMGNYRAGQLTSKFQFEPVSKILLVCSGPAWQTKKILDELKQGGFSCRIALLVRDGSPLVADGVPIHRYAGKKLTLGSVDAKTSESLNSEDYGIAIVQLNHNCADTSDYAEVFDVAERFSSKWVGVDINGNVQTGEPALHK